VPDLNQPLPDRAHEQLRQAVVSAIAGLAQNSSDAADGLDLTDVCLELIGAIFAQLDDLTTRLDALAPPPVTP
jgi:hypothetical protein